MDDKQRKKLWNDYYKTHSQDDRNKIILEYTQLVKIVAGRMAMYFGYNVEYEDLVSYGIFGLVDAIDKFDPTKDVKFETYASLRIRGSIIDQIRKMDWIPRSVRQKQRKVAEAVQEIGKKTDKEVTKEDIAYYLGITGEEYVEWETQIELTNISSLDEFIEGGDGEFRFDIPKDTERYENPENYIQKQELYERLKDSLNLLTEREREIVTLYYYNELTLKEIAKILDVSESRICQLHTKALKKMKTKMEGYMDIFINAM